MKKQNLIGGTLKYVCACVRASEKTYHKVGIFEKSGKIAGNFEKTVKTRKLQQFEKRRENFKNC